MLSIYGMVMLCVSAPPEASHLCGMVMRLLWGPPRELEVLAGKTCMELGPPTCPFSELHRNGAILEAVGVARLLGGRSDVFIISRLEWSWILLQLWPLPLHAGALLGSKSKGDKSPLHFLHPNGSDGKGKKQLTWSVATT